MVDLGITDWYAVGLLSLLSFFALRRVFKVILQFISPILPQIRNWRFFARSRRKISDWGTKHLVYRSLLRNGNGVDTFTRAYILCFGFYVAINLTCVFVRVVDLAESCSRAGALALINASVLYLGPCLDFIAALLSLRLRVQRQIHASAGYMVALLSSIHVSGTLGLEDWSFSGQSHTVLTILACVAVYMLIMPLNLIARILPYEVLLFLHHAVSILLCYAVWCHIPVDKQLARWFMYAIAGIFLFSVTLQAVITLYRNWFWFQSVSLEVNPKVCVQGNIETETEDKVGDKLGKKFDNGDRDQAGAIKHPGLGTGTDFDYVQVTLNLRKPLMIQPGQYIRLWVPLDFTSVVQSHPFAIADWSPDPRRDLELFVEVRRGLTKKLREELSLGMRSNIGMFTGPYGRTLSIEHYETILLVATGFGVAALIPYLQWLVHAVHSHKADIVPMHLFWQITSWKQPYAVFFAIDSALAEDKRKRKQSCTQCGKTHRDFSPFIKIHMYFEEQGSLPPEITWFARQMAGHERVNVGEKPLPLEDLLNSETVMSPARDGSRKTTMIAASVSKDYRGRLVKFARTRSSAVDLVFTDYQP